MRIRGTEGLTPADIQAEIARGGRFVAYQWCISVFVMTFKRVTSIQFLRAGQSGFGHNFGWSLFTLLAGWWGFPWGPIYTIGAIWTNLRGGIDVTEAIANDLAAQGAERAVPLAGDGVVRPRWSMAPLAAIGMIATAIGLFVANSTHQAAQHRRVALVNGIDDAYSVSIDGAEYKLRPHSITRLELPETEHAVVVSLPDGAGADQFTFTPDSDVTIVNPDAAALVSEEVSIYSSETKPTGRNPDPTLHAGKNVHHLRTPDYYLEEFPSTISMPSNSGRTRRTRVAVYAEFTIAQNADAILRQSGRKQMLAYLKDVGARLPNNEALLSYAFDQIEPSEADAFFGPNLAVRPVLVAWHRAYQNFNIYRHPEVDLHKEYRRLADENPDEGAFAYLYGRLVDDPVEENVWHTRGRSAKHPCAYASFALSFSSAAKGDIDGALALLDEARHEGLNNQSLRDQRITCLLAAGRFDDALAEHNNGTNSGPVDFGRASEAIHLAFLAKGEAAAKAAIDSFVAHLPAAIRKESGATIRKTYEGQLAYYRGDVETYAATFSAESDASSRFVAALCRNDRTGADSALGELPIQHSSSWLMLYLSAQLADDQRAEDYWQHALAAFATEPNNHKRLATHFDASDKLSAEELVDYPMDLGEKRIFLAALGLHEPEFRQACFDRAKLCNHSLKFPHHLVTAALNSAL